MALPRIHQAIHGYRDGHRLLSSSLPIGSDAARTMLVLSDMSGSSMLPGFQEYLTGYPLQGTDLYVLARTWYAPEMKRPGCVWTHSLLIQRESISSAPANRLVESFVRPEADGVEKAAAVPITIDPDPSMPGSDGLEDTAVAASLISGLLGQNLPVVVPVDAVAQVEPLFIRIWEELWPSARAQLTFCSGSLMPRTVSGALMDLQAVPRAVPSSQFRRAAGGALVLDLRGPAGVEPWAEKILESIDRGDGAFRSWMEAAAGADASRSAASSLVAIFGEWQQPERSAESVLTRILHAAHLTPGTKGRLVGMVLERTAATEGATGRRKLLFELCGSRGADSSSIAPVLEAQTEGLFAESRSEGMTFVLSLLGEDLGEVGERVLRKAILAMAPNDLEGIAEAHASFLPTLVGANAALAIAPEVWRRAGPRASEILSRLDPEEFTDDGRRSVVDAVLGAGRDAPINALVGFAQRDAIFGVLSAVVAGNLQVASQWSSSISARPEAVIDWLDERSGISSQELEVASLFLSPGTQVGRLEQMWQSGTGGSDAPPTPRVAAFGLALALSRRTFSPLFETCFQPTFDALASTKIDHDAWEWLRGLAPAVSWWRDWDRCERIAAAVARRLEAHEVPLATLFAIARTPSAVRAVVRSLDGDRDGRRYLSALRVACDTESNLGSREQRGALVTRGL